ncbi:hypothetical protein SNEBB_002859 [Seison nebaliae]|nr:hypothetical protein SNEBB_002859 [Seison nebaliae]
MFNNLRKKTLEASGKLPDAGFGFFQNVKQKFDSTVDDLSSTASRLKDNVMITSPMKDENSEDNMDDNVSMMSTDLTEVELLKKRNDKLKERLEKLRIEKEKVKNILSSTQDQALEKCEELRRTINEERLENDWKMEMRLGKI